MIYEIALIAGEEEVAHACRSVDVAPALRARRHVTLLVFVLAECHGLEFEQHNHVMAS